MVNTKIFDIQDLKSTDYDGFLKLLVNIAALIHSRPPIFKPHFSYALMLDSLFGMIEMNRKRRGEDNPNFSDERETVKYVQNKDLIELMNKKLEEDPNFNIPANFKKVYTREVDLKYELPSSFKIPHKFKICYEILHDMIDEQF